MSRNSGLSNLAISRINSLSELETVAAMLSRSDIQAVLVLVGGAAGIDDELEKRLKPFFAEVLARFAVEKRCCVIDGGTDAGIMRLIGRARAESKATFPLVGVAATGTVKISGESQLRTDAAAPEPNHSHLLFVPGDDWGDESKWIDRLAYAIGNDLPSLTVLVNGGEISRQDVQLSLKSKRHVIVVSGTGRLADELACKSERNPLIHIIPLGCKYNEFKEFVAKLFEKPKRRTTHGKIR